MPDRFENAHGHFRPINIYQRSQSLSFPFPRNKNETSAHVRGSENGWQREPRPRGRGRKKEARCDAMRDSTRLERSATLDDDGGRGSAQLYAETRRRWKKRERERERERDSASGHRGITRSNRFVELKIVDETREARPSREA